jgi:hypothetical protein
MLAVLFEGVRSQLMPQDARSSQDFVMDQGRRKRPTPYV